MHGSFPLSRSFQKKNVFLRFYSIIMNNSIFFKNIIRNWWQSWIQTISKYSKNECCFHYRTLTVLIFFLCEKRSCEYQIDLPMCKCIGEPSCASLLVLNVCISALRKCLLALKLFICSRLGTLENWATVSAFLLRLSLPFPLPLLSLTWCPFLSYII